MTVSEVLGDSGVKIKFIRLGNALLVKDGSAKHLSEATTRARNDGQGKPHVDVKGVARHSD